MNSDRVTRCDGCGKRQHPSALLMMGIQESGKAEVIYRLCSRCAVSLADGDKGSAAIDARARSRALKRNETGVLKA